MRGSPGFAFSGAGVQILLVGTSICFSSSSICFCQTKANVCFCSTNDLVSCSANELFRSTVDSFVQQPWWRSGLCQTPRTLAGTACARAPRLTIFRVAGVRFGFRRLAKGQFPPRFRPFRGFRPLRDLRAAAPSHCARFDQPRPDFPGSAGRPTSCDAREAAQAGRGCPIFFPADFLFKPLLAKLAKRCRAQRKEQLVSTHAGPNTSKITTSKTDIPGGLIYCGSLPKACHKLNR